MFDLAPLRQRGRKEVPSVINDMDEMIRNMWYGFPFHNLERDFDISWSPRLDLSETEKALEITADLPGLEKKDITISIEGDLLSIRGERKEAKEEKGKQYHTLERRSGGFFRSIRLPSEVDSAKVEAAFTNGVLTIMLPKTEESKKKVTQVKIK